MRNSRPLVLVTLGAISALVIGLVVAFFVRDGGQQTPPVTPQASTQTQSASPEATASAEPDPVEETTEPAPTEPSVTPGVVDARGLTPVVGVIRDLPAQDVARLDGVPFENFRFDGETNPYEGTRFTVLVPDEPLELPLMRGGDLQPSPHLTQFIVLSKPDYEHGPNPEALDYADQNVVVWLNLAEDCYLPGGLELPTENPSCVNFQIETR